VRARERIDEQRPSVLQIRDHHHRENAESELKPAIIQVIPLPDKTTQWNFLFTFVSVSAREPFAQRA
jgi:hypothetical protein